MAKLFKTYRKIDMPVPVGGEGIRKNNDLNGGLGVAQLQCIFCSTAKSSNLKDCGTGQQESKINVWDMRHCLNVVLWDYHSFK